MAAPKEQTSAPPPPLLGIKDLVDAGPSIIANKPNEAPSKLGLTANKITFLCKDDKKPVSVTIKIFNPTNELYSFKVRCTSSDFFRVQPPTGALPAKSGKELSLWFNNSGKPLELNNKHYFAFYHYKGDCRESKDVLAGKIEGVRRLPAIFEMKKDSKKDAKESKKEEEKDKEKKENPPKPAEKKP